MIAIARFAAAAAATLAAGFAAAQQPAPPAFAPSNLTPAGVRSLAANCAACHGTNGKRAPGSTLAGLAGKPRDELLLGMTQFKQGKKPGTIMPQLAKGYTDEQIELMAGWFAAQPAK
mgnify:CR=1 FL=1